MIKTDICIIDAGSSGLLLQLVQCKLVLKLSCVKTTILMVIILIIDCVISKAIIEASRVIAKVNKAQNLGINIDKFDVDYKKV